MNPSRKFLFLFLSFFSNTSCYTSFSTVMATTGLTFFPRHVGYCKEKEKRVKFREALNTVRSRRVLCIFSRNMCEEFTTRGSCQDIAPAACPSVLLAPPSYMRPLMEMSQNGSFSSLCFVGGP